MVEGATNERSRRIVGRISRRPSTWLAWLLWVLVVAIGEVQIIPYQIDWFGLTHLSSLNGEGILDALGGPILVLAVSAFATVGAVVATLRPKNGVGWLCMALGLLVVVAGVQPGVEAYGIPRRVLDPVTSAAFNLTIPPLPITLMLLIFPEGRLPSRRWWAVVVVASAGYILTFLGMWKVGLCLSIAALLASAASVVLRWRRNTGQERQQLKWLAYVVTLAVGAALAGLVGGQVWADAYVPAVLLVAAGVGLGIPAAIGFAVLKYRLYDIDVLINRTLVYATLTGTLALMYFGGVTATQALLRNLTGREQLPQFVVVASTLVIAALFNPLRRRIQSIIDRSFYRRKYDAAKTLEGFSEKLRDETDLEALRGDLVGLVRETMQPAHVSLWLRPETASKDE